MNAIGTIIGIKKATDDTALDKPENSNLGEPAKSQRNIVELESEPFFPVASQVGEDNESVRNLLINVENKVSDLETTRLSIVALVEPVNKILRAFEETKSEKISLQSALNTIRLANNKLRSDFDASEKKNTAVEGECLHLRETIMLAEQKIASLEAIKAEQSAELVARRSQGANLQQNLQEQSADLQRARDESRRLGDRLTQSEKHAFQLESESEALRQKMMLTDNERITLKTSLEKTNAELGVLSQRILDTEKSLAAAQIKSQKNEAQLNEANSERQRLVTALDDINQKHQNELIAQRTNHETLQARATLTEKLLEEARQSLTERAEEIRAFFDPGELGDSARMHSVIGEKLDMIETTLAERTAKINELEQARAMLAEQNDMLTKSVSRRENAYNRAQEHIHALEERIQLVEGETKAVRQSCESEIEILNAKLQREQISRTMAEGAVEAGRKDVARLLQELGAVQYRPQTSSPNAAMSTEPSAAKQDENFAKAEFTELQKSYIKLGARLQGAA